MRTHEIVAAVDFDEVIYPWYERAHKACEMAGVTGECTRPLTWTPYEEYGITDQEWYDVLREATLSGYLYSAQPLPGVVDALDLMREHGVTIHVVTARGTAPIPLAAEIRVLTYEYIDTHELAVDGIFFTPDKEGVARSLKATHAIDDHLRNYEAFERAGAITYLHDQPWNFGTKVPEGRRVQSLGEFVERILQRVSV